MTRTLGGALALACALLLPAFAWAATLTATPANVWPQVQAAQPGDVVQLQTGAYVLDLWNLPKAAPGVTVMPAPGAVVTASEIDTSGSANLILKGIEVVASASTQYAVTCGGGCTGDVFDGLKVHQADPTLMSGVGIFLRSVQGVTVRTPKSTGWAWASAPWTARASCSRQQPPRQQRGRHRPGRRR
jgi:hypothetical protein